MSRHQQDDFTFKWKQAGLEYVGPSAKVKIITQIEKSTAKEFEIPAPAPGFAEFMGEGNIWMSYVLNPFDPDTDRQWIIDLVRFEFSRLIINHSKTECEVAHGKGVLRDYRTQLPVYIGDFDSGFRSGKGKAPIYSGRRVYEGDYLGMWKFSMRHGNGQMTYPDGSVFRGNFVHDLKAGHGVEVDSYGAKFIGTWKNGVRHGSGIYVWAEAGQIESREYVNGKLVRFLSVPKVPTKFQQAADELDNFFKSFTVESAGLKAAEVNPNPVGKPAPAPFTGLAMKKQVQSIQTIFKEDSEELQKVTGKPVAIELDEQPIKDSPLASVVLFMMENDRGSFCSGVIVNSIKDTCLDDMGREAVAQLKKIVVSHTKEDKKTSATFKDGTLTLFHHFSKPLIRKELTSLIGMSM